MPHFNRRNPLQDKGQIQGQSQVQTQNPVAFNFKFKNPIYLKRLNNEYDRFEVKSFAGQVQKIDVDTKPFGITWIIKIKPALKKYKGFSFTVSIKFPEKYPFQPPSLHFINRTGIRHPNVDKNGQVYLDILHSQNWNSNIVTEEIIESLFIALEVPEMNNIMDKNALVEYQNRALEEEKNRELLEDINEDEED